MGKINLLYYFFNLLSCRQIKMGINWEGNEGSHVRRAECNLKKNESHPQENENQAD